MMTFLNSFNSDVKSVSSIFSSFNDKFPLALWYLNSLQNSRYTPAAFGDKEIESGGENSILDKSDNLHYHYFIGIES